MATYEINYKSDFTLVMGFTLAGVAVPLPVGNFRVVFRTQEYGTEYECSRINGEYVNCQDNGNDTLLCIFDRHGLRPGALRGEVFDYIPDTTFPDGSQLVVTPSLFDIELVEGAGNTSEGVTADVVISVEEVVGQARDAALAAENAAESANTAAGSASNAADRANDAADAATEAIADLDDKLAAKQDTLVSGQNIKTINNLSLLGSGNIVIQGGGGEQVQSDWTETDSSDPAYIKNKPTLATVATSGSYNDLTNKPTIPAAVSVVDNLNSTSATDALSANQGRVLKGLVDAKAESSELSNYYDIATTDTMFAEKQDIRTYVDNSADASVQLAVTTYNDLGTLSSWKTITLPASYDRADEFVFRFVCNDASLTPTLPSGVVMADNFEWSEMAVGVVYQVSIVDGVAAYLVLTPQNP